MEDISSYHVEVAAEAIAAGMFALQGYDVSVRYGANQPEYDFVIAKKEKYLKVSVKGSQTGRWGLTQSYKKGNTYHDAIKIWLAKHNKKTIMCFVQFKDIPQNMLPRVYLATPREVAKRLRETANRRGATILYEHKEWTDRAGAAGSIDAIPRDWRFSKKRIRTLLNQA